MANNEREMTRKEMVGDQPVREEDIGFSPEEMAECSGCKRKNPPNRAKCIYCGHELEIEGLSVNLIAACRRRLEPWENGFNVIHVAGASGGDHDITVMAGSLSLDPEDLKSILKAGSSLPIARFETGSEASLLAEQLAGFGLNCRVIGDLELAVNKPPVRLRSIEVHKNRYVLETFNTAARIELPTDDLALIVVGHVFESRTESVEKRKRGKTLPVDEIWTSSDEMVLDLYTAGDSIGFRVPSSGFDFSCLGSEKQLRAAENMDRLVSRLRQVSPLTLVFDDYLKRRDVLDLIWEPELMKDGLSSPGPGLGRRERIKTTSVSNIRQFTKYSRMQRILL
jgi:hypothetical protein